MPHSRSAAAPSGCPETQLTDSTNEGIHDAQSEAFHGLIALFGVSEFCLEGALKHRDLKDADPAAWTSKPTAEQAWEATEGFGQAFIHRVELAVDRRDQPGAEAIGAVGIEVDFKDVLPRADRRLAWDQLVAGSVVIADGDGRWGVGA